MYSVLAFTLDESEAEWDSERRGDIGWTYSWVCIDRRVIIRDIVSVFSAICLRLTFVILLK